MSDGATKSGSKKPHYTQVYKQEIADKQAHIDRLEAQLAATQNEPASFIETLTPTTTIPEPAAPVTITEPLPVIPLGVTDDPLAWITRKTVAVYMVSGTSSFGLRPENPRSNPPTRAVNQNATGTASPWYSCPFDFRNDADRTKEQNERVMKSNWWHHSVHRDTAKMWDMDERFERRTETVVRADAYRGWNSELKEPNGEKQEVTDFIPLRELVRYLLQKGGSTFLDWGRHMSDFDPRVPNPYANYIPSVGKKMLPSVADWAAAGRMT